jgi:hypothetical protein|tara:strand:- start:210 stop:782 length:573 start_codon:yes stop_codon:yes gene_type:complete
MNTIENLFVHYSNKSSDINEHMPTLKKYAGMSESIMEMGVREVVSTWAFLAGKPKKLTSLDLYRSKNMDIVEKVSRNEGLDFEFLVSDSLEIDIEEVDLLFIDTFHHYDQLRQELSKHHFKAKKWIIMHDTTLFAHKCESFDSINSLSEFNKDCKKGLWDAVQEFIYDNQQWFVKERFTNNNGLTVLERK